MKRWLIWAAASGAMLVASAYAFLNFWAAADLGYDTSARGKSILAFWGYAMVGFFLGSVVSAALAFKAWRASSKATHSSAAG
jgi:hypothetical protein